MSAFKSKKISARKQTWCGFYICTRWCKDKFRLKYLYYFNFLICKLLHNNKYELVYKKLNKFN